MSTSALLSALTISIEALAKPVVVSAAKIGSDEITTVLMSDKLLGPFLLLNAVQLIVFLIKMVWSKEKKSLDEIKEAVKHIPMIIHKIETMDTHLKNNVPTRSEMELKVFRIIHGMKDKE